MSHPEPKAGGARYARRRKVRIVGHKTPSRAAMWSLIGAVGAALLIPVFWRFGRGQGVEPPPQRGMVAMDMDWRCESGHTFAAQGHTVEADGTTAPKPCSKCGKPSYPVFALFCPYHGAVDVSVRFTENEAGRVKPVAWRLSGKPWLDSVEKLRCVQCKRALQYRKDPLLTLDRERSGRGGG
jgi:hypothetical protein